MNNIYCSELANSTDRKSSLHVTVYSKNNHMLYDIVFSHPLGTDCILKAPDIIRW